MIAELENEAIERFNRALELPVPPRDDKGTTIGVDIDRDESGASRALVYVD